ncbi:MAG: hypothetical protein K2L64_02525, partial [Ureaplasma sp.]|nr:hypothetical protein [Ureaplasma sp.]
FDVELKLDTTALTSSGERKNTHGNLKNKFNIGTIPPMMSTPGGTPPHHHSDMYVKGVFSNFDYTKNFLDHTEKPEYNSADLHSNSEESIIFKKLAFSDLKDFEIFLDRGKLKASDYSTNFNDETIKDSVTIDKFHGVKFTCGFATEGACLTNTSYSGGHKFDKGSFKILDFASGDAGVELSFDVIVRLSKSTIPSYTDMESIIDTKINKLFNSDDTFISKSFSKLAFLMKRNFMTIFKNMDPLFVNKGNDFSYMFSSKLLDHDNRNINKLWKINDFTRIDNDNLAISNPFLFGPGVLNLLNYQDYISKDTTKINGTNRGLNEIDIHYDNILDQSVNGQNTRELINENSSNLKLVVEYNGNPLFEIDKKLPQNASTNTFASNIYST